MNLLPCTSRYCSPWCCCTALPGTALHGAAALHFQVLLSMALLHCTSRYCSPWRCCTALHGTASTYVCTSWHWALCYVAEVRSFDTPVTCIEFWTRGCCNVLYWAGSDVFSPAPLGWGPPNLSCHLAGSFAAYMPMCARGCCNVLSMCARGCCNVLSMCARGCCNVLAMSARG
jgi:hypothetical protein